MGSSAFRQYLHQSESEQATVAEALAWEPSRQARRAQAEAALAALGLSRRPEPNADGSDNVDRGE
jgi:hypothetical protein